MKPTFPNSLYRLASCYMAASLSILMAEPTQLNFSGKSGVDNGKHVVLLSGDEEYRSEECLPMLAKILSQRHGFKCTVLFALDADGSINPENQKSLPGSEALEKADALIMLTRFRQWPDAAMERFEKAWLAGKPIIALRTSTHPFNFPPESRWSRYTWNQKTPWAGGFGKQVLGETWVSHWGKHKHEAGRAIIEPAAKENSLLRGVGDIFVLSDIYEAAPPADASVLMRGQVLAGMTPDSLPVTTTKPRTSDKLEQPVNDPMMPVTWTRQYKNEAGNTNRIFCTTMGAATDFEDEDLRRLVVNAVFWGLEMDVPEKADVAYVDAYHPSFYGFGSYRKGLRVSDLELGKALPSVGTPKPATP